MEKSLWDHLRDSLDDLNSSDFKTFVDKLCHSGLNPRIRVGEVEGKRGSDIARLLIVKYTEKRAAEVTVNVLRSLGFNQIADELESNVGGTQIPPTSPPVPKPDTPGISQPDIPNPPGISQPDIPNPPGISQSDILIPCNVQFKQKVFQEKGNDVYNVKEMQSRERLALLINNVEFDCKSLRRNGAEKDEENMEKLLIALGYKVVKHTNLSAKEMDEKIKDFAQRTEHANSDSTFVVIMSHGKRDAILGVHYRPNNADALPVDRIYVHLNASNCPSLHDKPKVILIQACRGGEDGAVWVPDNEEIEMSDMESDDVVHKEKDFISLLSCTPDTKSFRHKEHGTLFIKYIVEVFNVNAHQDHIEELFRQVMMHFASFKSLRQMVCKDRTSLVKLFYLFPGL